MQLNLNIDEISDKYGVPEWAVKEEIEKAFSHVLSNRLGQEIEVQTDNSNVRIWKFAKNGDFAILGTGEIKKNIIREIKWNLVKYLLKRSVLESYEMHKNKVRTVVYGTIMKQMHGILHVEIHPQNINDDIAMAVCEPASQTPKERGRYKAGEVLPFYVLSVRPVLEKEIPRLEVKLSRNSKGLAEKLIKEQIKEKSIDIRIKCIKRVAGAYSLIESSKKIPGDCIKRVANELKERIICRF